MTGYHRRAETLLYPVRCPELPCWRVCLVDLTGIAFVALHMAWTFFVLSSSWSFSSFNHPSGIFFYLNLYQSVQHSVVLSRLSLTHPLPGILDSTVFNFCHSIFGHIRLIQALLCELLQSFLHLLILLHFDLMLFSTSEKGFR